MFLSVNEQTLNNINFVHLTELLFIMILIVDTSSVVYDSMQIIVTIQIIRFTLSLDVGTMLLLF